MNNDAVIETKTTDKTRLKINLKDYTSVLGLALLVVISAVLSPTFIKPENIMNVITQIAAPSLLAFGMTFVILTGGIDLSVGSVVALGGVTVALLTPHFGWLAAVLLAFVVGIGIGLMHGFFITKFNVPAFIATLAGLTAARGLALVLTNAAAVPINAKGFDVIGSGKIDSRLTLAAGIIVMASLIFNFVKSYKYFESGESAKKIAGLVMAAMIISVFQFFIMRVNGLSVQIAIAIIIVVIGAFVLNKTVFGREIYALGGNYDAARLAGIKTKKNLLAIYAISGFLAALSGVLVSARLSSGTPQVGNSGELDAIAGVVIGGTSMVGGIGSLGGTIIGVLLIGVLNNLLSLLNVQSDMKLIFKGAIILVAVVLDTSRLKKSR